MVCLLYPYTTESGADLSFELIIRSLFYIKDKRESRLQLGIAAKWDYAESIGYSLLIFDAARKSELVAAASYNWNRSMTNHQRGCVKEPSTGSRNKAEISICHSILITTRNPACQMQPAAIRGDITAMIQHRQRF